MNFLRIVALACAAAQICEREVSAVSLRARTQSKVQLQGAKRKTTKAAAPNPSAVTVASSPTPGPAPSPASPTFSTPPVSEADFPALAPSAAASAPASPTEATKQVEILKKTDSTTSLASLPRVPSDGSTKSLADDFVRLRLDGYERFNEVVDSLAQSGSYAFGDSEADTKFEREFLEGPEKVYL